jgi:hypothetical protein
MHPAIKRKIKKVQKYKRRQNEDDEDSCVTSGTARTVSRANERPKDKQPADARYG